AAAGPAERDRDAVGRRGGGAISAGGWCARRSHLRAHAGGNRRSPPASAVRGDAAGRVAVTDGDGGGGERLACAHIGGGAEGIGRCAAGRAVAAGGGGGEGGGGGPVANA